MTTTSTPKRTSNPAIDDEQLSGKAARMVELKLYIARSTPNSVRAVQNLDAALKTVVFEGILFNIEVIDVFTHGKRAIRDNVIVTPTLIVSKGGKNHTIVGDLSETVRLHALLAS